jgi:indole-3-glycerol phosphate synthase
MCMMASDTNCFCCRTPEMARPTIGIEARVFLCLRVCLWRVNVNIRRILAVKRQEVAAAKQKQPFGALSPQRLARGAADFTGAPGPGLRRQPAVIAGEAASPSKGAAPEFDPRIARSYAARGAPVGADHDSSSWAARPICRVRVQPARCRCCAKFHDRSYQIASAAMGAGCVLLIVAASGTR